MLLINRRKKEPTRYQVDITEDTYCYSPNSMFKQAKKNEKKSSHWGAPRTADSFRAKHIMEASGIGKGTSLGQSSLSLSHDLTTLPSVHNFMPGIVLRNEGSWQTERLIGWERRDPHLSAILRRAAGGAAWDLGNVLGRPTSTICKIQSKRRSEGLFPYLNISRLYIKAINVPILLSSAWKTSSEPITLTRT